MGKYITHENLPFHGTLTKIRIKTDSNGSCRLPNKKTETEQLLEITRAGRVTLSRTYYTKGLDLTQTEKQRSQLSAEDTAYIFAAFSSVFQGYQKTKVSHANGYWKVRLLSDTNEVFFFHGANGEDYEYEGKNLSTILRDRTGMSELLALAAPKIVERSISCIDIQYTQQNANADSPDYIAPDIVERLIISASQGTIAYNRRGNKVGRVSLQFELPEAIKDLIGTLDSTHLFSKIIGNPTNVAPTLVERAYHISVSYDDWTSTELSGSFDKKGLPSDWAEFIEKIRDFVEAQSLGDIFQRNIYSKVRRCEDEIAFCGVDARGVAGIRYYRCSDDISVGDLVIIPILENDTPEIGRVTEIMYCKESEVTDALKNAKQIFSKATTWKEQKDD